MARCKEDILAARGVKPTLSPNLNTLATVEALDVKRLLFIGVGCQACAPAVTAGCSLRRTPSMPLQGCRILHLAEKQTLLLSRCLLDRQSICERVEQEVGWRRTHGVLRCLVRLQVQALRSVEQYLNLDALYVLGTNCVDNGPREGLEKFLNAASADPGTVLHYEFMQVPPCCCSFCGTLCLYTHTRVSASRPLNL